MPENDASTPSRTPTPSDWEHIAILMKLRLFKDRKKPKMWIFRTLGVTFMLMLYTIGFVANYQNNEDSTVQGDFRLFAGEPTPISANVALAASSIDVATKIFDGLQNSSIRNVVMSNETNRTLFEMRCEEYVRRSPWEQVCVFFDAVNSYTILFNDVSGGVENVNGNALAGTQLAINDAILNVSSVANLFPVKSIQEFPKSLEDSGLEASPVFPLVIGGLTMLALTISLGFVMGPMTYEKLQEISRAYFLVGVKFRSYMLHWFFYYSLNSIITAGGLTFCSVVWRLYPQSSGGLIYLSHLFALIQLNALLVVLAQIVTQEELAQGMPFLLAVASVAVGAACIIVESPEFVVLTILTAVSPFVGIIQYTAIYVNYDVYGFGTGVHIGDNFSESGLLANMVAQLVGIALWVTAILLYSSPTVANLLKGKSHTFPSQEEDPEAPNATNMDHFEPLEPGKEVLLSVRGIYHSYLGGCVKKMCKAPPVEVLKGLDMDICRGEVFSYLGHNGAGKTTSVRILSGELDLMEGEVTYNLRDGSKNLQNQEDAELIRSKIGVCPQHNNSLQSDMTCREMLRLFGRLKGRIAVEPGQSKEEALEAEIERRLEDIKFTSEEDADKPVGTYSGGMKRKVSIAMALLGDPEVIFLDEPTAGMDPYNRRTIWDMIIAAKAGRSIILTTHFMDEADVLSDRVGIIKKGKLITCGSTLFLKHHFGVGYTLNFEEANPVDIGSYVDGAERVTQGKPGVNTWRLSHGTEGSFAPALEALSEAGATNVSLELTTLEQVFLETGKEDEEEFDDEEGDAEDDDDEIDMEDPATKASYLSKIWEVRSTVKPLGAVEKFLIVQNFMMSNAWKIKGVIFLNITMPLVYLVGGFVGTSFLEIQSAGDRVEPVPIPISQFNAGLEPSQFFGLPNSTLFAPISTVAEPQRIEDLFVGGPRYIGGYFAGNETLQYNPDFSSWALQVGATLLANATALISTGGGIDGIVTAVQQLPYVTETPFRLDLLIVPMVLGFGFVGMTFSVLDILLLKGDNIISLFQVGGISEWSAYLGVMLYKVATTFFPFFSLVIVLGFALGSMLFGNAGRWLATILIMLSYAYSSTPIGLVLAKRFIHSDFKEVANWFPGVYMTFVSMPYMAWNIALQSFPDSRGSLLVLGDILCFCPPVAFQRALGAVLEVSTKFNDPDLTWAEVWEFQTRIWFATLIMILTGTIEWVYLYRLTHTRPSTTKLRRKEREEHATPVTIEDADIAEEKARSAQDNEGVVARELVKVFAIPNPNSRGNPKFKRAVKGVSYAVKKNEVFALLGPNGAGKSVTMGILAGDHTPEHGEIALDGQVASQREKNIQYLYSRCNVSYCPQFDALFPKKTVAEHLRFYATIRGLDWAEEATQEHIEAIVKLLGLGKHRDKMSTELSGGYKRRLCLGIAMIGYPHCIMVDECTTGMDPGARHLVWNVLKPDTLHDGYDLPAILLSTHYMDEATKLGTRIGIMIDGELAAAGSLDRLQNRYCTSYFVEVSLEADADPERGQQEVVDTFASHWMLADLYESLPYHFKLQVPFVEGQNSTNQLASIFGLLESNRKALRIKFYSVAQMNLEQIFIDLSRKQFAVDVEETVRGGVVSSRFG